MMTIRQALRFCLPHGIVEIRRKFRDLSRIGVRPFRALSVALDDEKWHGVVTAQALLLPPLSVARLEVIVDVGANDGRWSKPMLQICCPSKLIAVEPHPGAFAQLKQRLKDFENVDCIQAAAGSKPGETVLNCTAASNCSSLLTPSEAAVIHYGAMMSVVKKMAVPMITLDSLTEKFEKISLLKLDVQGYEKEVLAGACTTLSKTQMILIEVNFQSHYNDDSLFCEIDALLTPQGFHLANMAGAFVADNKALWSDALYCRDSFV